MINWAYLAGFFDGEGSLHMDDYKSTVQLRIDNTFKEVILEIQLFLGFGKVSNRGRAKSYHKDRIRLTVSNHVEVLKMLERMLPYLVVKRKKAGMMISYKGKKWKAYRGSRRKGRI